MDAISWENVSDLSMVLIQPYISSQLASACSQLCLHFLYLLNRMPATCVLCLFLPFHLVKGTYLNVSSLNQIKIIKLTSIFKDFQLLNRAYLLNFLWSTKYLGNKAWSKSKCIYKFHKLRNSLLTSYNMVKYISYS